MATNNEELKEKDKEETEAKEAAESSVQEAEEPKEEIIKDFEGQEEQQEEESEPEPSEEEKIARELETVKDQLLRMAAEYDNYRKRTSKEKLELRPVIISDIVKEFLPVMDNLTRALETECTDEKYKQGVQMIYDSFIETLKKLGVEEIPSDGVMFDHNLHQAVQKVDAEGLESGMVVKTLAKGYKINDKVIRFSMVTVAN